MPIITSSDAVTFYQKHARILIDPSLNFTDLERRALEEDKDFAFLHEEFMAKFAEEAKYQLSNYKVGNVNEAGNLKRNIILPTGYKINLARLFKAKPEEIPKVLKAFSENRQIFSEIVVEMISSQYMDALRWLMSGNPKPLEIFFDNYHLTLDFIKDNETKLKAMEKNFNKRLYILQSIEPGICKSFDKQLTAFEAQYPNAFAYAEENLVLFFNLELSKFKGNAILPGADQVKLLEKLDNLLKTRYAATEILLKTKEVELLSSHSAQLEERTNSVRNLESLNKKINELAQSYPIITSPDIKNDIENMLTEKLEEARLVGPNYFDYNHYSDSLLEMVQKFIEGKEDQLSLEELRKEAEIQEQVRNSRRLSFFTLRRNSDQKEEKRPSSSEKVGCGNCKCSVM